MSNGIDFGFLSYKLPMHSVSLPLHLGPDLKGECMNQKAKPHKPSLVIEDQNDIRVLGLCGCGLVWEEFEYNELTLIALYYGKICPLLKTRLHFTLIIIAIIAIMF